MLASTPYLSPDAEVHSAELPSLVDVGQLADSVVYSWLRKRVSNTDAVTCLSLAAHDFASWLAANEGTSPLTITVGHQDPRVLITLQDQGTSRPDLQRSRYDVAMVYRVLGPYVAEWECDQNAAGIRTVRIYGDVTAPRVVDPEEWPQ